MKACPNCGKLLNGNFTYCWRCGCNLEAGDSGDFTTPHLNVFRRDEDYIYLFSIHGNQVILRASSIEELKVLVHMNRFPWMDIEIGDAS